MNNWRKAALPSPRQSGVEARLSTGRSVAENEVAGLNPGDVSMGAESKDACAVISQSKPVITAGNVSHTRSEGNGMSALLLSNSKSRLAGCIAVNYMLPSVRG